MKESYDIAIIGGGASGLAAAVTAARKAEGISVAVFEKKDAAGKKLSATGNGRCNISNIRCENLEQVMDFFGSVGISVRKDEEGRLYPYGEDAGEVTSLLTACAHNEGVRIFLNSEITGMEAKPDGGFLLFVGGKDTGKGDIAVKIIEADNVLLAAGGKSYASLGTTGDGYIMARKLGHSVVKLVPALTAVEVLENLNALKGVRAKAEASLYKDGKKVFSERGEVQFRADSLSGICIMNMSRFIRRDSDYEIGINLVADFEEDELLSIIESRFSIKGLTAGEALKTLVKKPLAELALRNAGIKPEEKAGTVLHGSDRRQRLDRLAGVLQDMRFEVKGLKGWNEAQVTAGGVSLDEVNPLTMESKLVSGLFFSGEVLDYDGPCGGYNLHHAWLTGIRAGKGMADRCIEFTR